jgi:poly(3-hydroxybutyrate) depolymerase
LIGAERLVASQPEYLRHEIAPSDHLGLFMGKQTLAEYWPRIAHWMKKLAPEAPSGDGLSSGARHG